jgi:isopenicillin-N N-acyltransferase-like protein
MIPHFRRERRVPIRHIHLHDACLTMKPTGQQLGARHASIASVVLTPCVGVACLLVSIYFSDSTLADENSPSQRKSAALQTASKAPDERRHELFLRPTFRSGGGHRIIVGKGEARVPLVVVRGTPYEMGHQLGNLIADQMQAFIPTAMAGLTSELKVSQEDLRDVWSRTAAYTDDRVEQEMAGLADGSQFPLAQLQAMHAVPLLMPYSCSSIAAWGDATRDGHLYQTRNLDWSLEVGAHDFPVIVVYIPDDGIPHVVPTFAGMIGAHTGMNARGIALSEMGDASSKEMPYQVHAPHFTTFFRTMLYDAESLTDALDLFAVQEPTKRYHYVFGDGQKEHRAVKIRAHAPESSDQRVVIWKDNDPTDEFAPRVLPDVVYNDEGRGAFPLLQDRHGSLDAKNLVGICNKIPIKGGNVVNVVYDATALRLWVSYAKGRREAYQRPYVFVDLRQLDADQDGQPDLATIGN